MSHPLAALVAKDLYLSASLIAAVLLSGAVSLGVCFAGPVGFAIGSVCFLSSLIAFGCIQAMTGAFKERSGGTLLFALSLPVSTRGYLAAKVLGALLSYLIPWSVLTATAAALLGLSSRMPHALLPVTVLMCGFLLFEFCLMTCTALLTSSERWINAVIIACNVSVTLFLFGLMDLPRIAAAMQRPAEPPVWDATVLSILGALLGLGALCLVLPLLTAGTRKTLL